MNLLPNVDGLVIVTPDLAKKILESCNVKNRRVRPGLVRKYARQMQSGVFRPTKSVPIAFDTSGHLVNGQHRLLGVIESGCEFVQMYFVFGCDPGEYQVIEQGGIRDTGDITGCTQRTSEIINAATLIASGGAQRTNEIKYACRDAFAPTADELHDLHPVRVKVFSSTPIRLAAVCSAILGRKEYAFSLYGKLTHNDLDDLPAIARAFVGQVLRGTISRESNYAAVLDKLARGLKVFDPACADCGKLQINSCDEARAVVKRILFGDDDK